MRRDARMAPRRMLAALLLCTLRSVAASLYGASSPVLHDLTDSNYRTKLKGLVLLELYAPWCGHCKQLTPEWEKLAKAMKAVGALTVAAADCDANKQIGAAYELKGFPTIVATLDGKLLETYQGERTAVAVAKWGMKVANAEVAKRLSGGGGGSKSGGAKPPPSEPGAGKAVLTLSESNFDKKVVSDSAPWMVEFYAPWCGHCKQLAPEWASAAEVLAPRGVKLGAVDCTANEALCSRFGVSGYPSILVFGRDKSAHSPYEGPRTSAGVQAFATRLLETDGAPPEVPQLLGAEGYAAACTASGRQACVLAFLPHILDASASARNRTLATLIKSAGAFAGRPWGWAWLEAAAQPELERALGVSQFPAVAMLNANKQVSSLMRASLSADNVKDFLNTLPGAAPVTLPAQELLATTQPWDGKDAEVPEMVDEFSLDEL